MKQRTADRNNYFYPFINKVIIKKYSPKLTESQFFNEQRKANILAGNKF